LIPGDAEKMAVRVVAAVIERDGKLLVCERPAHKRHGGLWEFPGGKVEPGETDTDAIIREIAEELGVHVVEVWPAELSTSEAGSEFEIVFLPVTIEGEPRALEHNALMWASVEDLSGIALAPCDARYAHFRTMMCSGEQPS
jgi:mutator protein MutT